MDGKIHVYGGINKNGKQTGLGIMCTPVQMTPGTFDRHSHCEHPRYHGIRHCSDRRCRGVGCNARAVSRGNRSHDFEGDSVQKQKIEAKLPRQILRP